MLRVKVEGIEELTANLNDMAKSQVPFATALALTRTARKAKSKLYGEMRSKLDRPSPFVVPGPGFEEYDSMGSMRVEQARPDRLFAVVKMKDWTAAKQRVATDPLLRHHFFGGARVAKGMELMLRDAGLLGAGEYLVLGKEMEKNRYGNIPKDRWEQVKSQLQLAVSGSEHRSSNSRRSKQKVATTGKMWWSSGTKGGKLIDIATGIEYGTKGRGHNLPKGVWWRDGSRLICVLAAVDKAPSYKQRFDLQQIAANAVQQNFTSEFRQALKDAIKNSGYKGTWKR